MRDYGYGLWVLVAIDSAIFILFAFSFFHPTGGRDWKALYRRLSLREELEVSAAFGEEWDQYARLVPRFIPARGRSVVPTDRLSGSRPVGGSPPRQ